MGKFIVELKEGERLYKYSYPEVHEIVGVPYTEDSAYAHGFTEVESKFREIRDELEKQAYQKGHQDAYDTAYKDAEEIYESGKRAMYQKGLKDAWEAARTLWNTPNRKEIFGHTAFLTALTTLTAQETIEKIRQYEQEKEEIQVGDEVKNTQTDARFIVTHMWVNNHGEKGVSGFNHNCSAFSTTIELVKKTGRRFPEIAEVLAKMKESDNG